MSADLPRGWAKTELGSLIDGFEAGRSLLAQGRTAIGEEYGVLKISAVTWGEFRPTENKALLAKDTPKAHELVRAGDLLISRANTSDLVGAVVLVERDYPSLMLPDKLLRVRVRDHLVDRRYLLYALRSQEVRKHFADNATGTSDSMRNLAQPKIAASPVRLPPLAEQRRIATEVDTLTGHLNAANSRLGNVPAVLRRFRQSVLTAACAGRLTEDWRAKNSPESIEQTLARVVVRESNTGRAATDEVIPGKAILSVGQPDKEAPPGWKWTPLTEVAKLESGHTPSRKHPEYWGGKFAWIGILDAGAHHGGVINGTSQTVTQAGLDNSAARLLPPGTVCLSRTASVGYVVIMGRTMATSQDFVNWVCSGALVPEFLMYALMAEGADIKRFGRGSTHTTIYFPEVKALHICLPPVDEQREIVRRIVGLLPVADDIAATVDRAAQRAEKVTQAVLEKAFRGELVPTEADLAAAEGRTYESAEQLLARACTAAETTPKAKARVPRKRHAPA